MVLRRLLPWQLEQKVFQKCQKYLAPGNQYVTKAKELALEKGVGIDMPAGPSELLVIADDSANPQFVAADLLSQAEHGPDSQVILVTTSETFLDRTKQAIKNQLDTLPRKSVAEKALNNSISVQLDCLDSCMAFSNYYAPEHLILATENALEFSEDVINAGSVFIGNYSCESAGDYASGTNHTLPTNDMQEITVVFLSTVSYVKLRFKKLVKAA